MASEEKDNKTHRIFTSDTLHRLQVRYPWFLGYAAAPLAFIYANQCYDPRSSSSLLSRLPPLLGGDKSLPSLKTHATGAAILFCGHFLRRAWEVIFVNDCKSPRAVGADRKTRSKCAPYQHPSLTRRSSRSIFFFPLR